MQTLAQLLAATEQRLLNRVLPQLFGYYLVHCCESKQNICDIQSSPILKKFRLSSTSIAQQNLNLDAIANYHELPFKCDSLDVIILQHIIEYAPHPALILEQAWQQLIPGGHLVILGYNPHSLLGLWYHLQRKLNKSPSLAHLRHQLGQNNFAIVEEQTDFFLPPLQNIKLLQQLRFLNVVGASICSGQGGIYMLVARKIVRAITPIKPVWSQLAFARGCPRNEPATQNNYHGK